MLYVIPKKNGKNTILVNFTEILFLSLNFKKSFFHLKNFVKRFFNSLDTKIGMKKEFSQQFKDEKEILVEGLKVKYCQLFKDEK